MKAKLLTFVRGLKTGTPPRFQSYLKSLTLLLVMMVGVGEVWGGTTPTVLFHETFGTYSSKGTVDWDASKYSVKSGISTVYSSLADYTVSNWKVTKGGQTGSGLLQTTKGTDAYIIIGPLNVSSYTSLSVSYQWKAASTSATYTTKLYYATSSTGSYTEVTGGTGTGSTSFVKRSYSLPTAAQVSTLYLKAVWNTSNTQAAFDEFELTGVAGASGFTVDFAVNPAGYGSVSPSDQLKDIASGTTISANNNVLIIGTSPTATEITATPATQTAQYSYAFDNWSWGTNSPSTITENTTATANFTRSNRVYNVTYNLNSGSWNGTAGASTYTYGTGIATLATNVQRSGYTFIGWYDNSELTGTAVTSIAENATGDKTFWAKWEEVAQCQDKITINKGQETNGTFTLTLSGSDICIDNGAVSTTVNAVPSQGYYLSGVSSLGENSKTIGTIGNISDNSCTVSGINANTTITAIFDEIPSHNVTWSVNGATSSVSYKEGEAIAFTTPSTNIPDGYAFRGWYNDNYSNETVEPTYITSANMGTSDITYYAVFGKIGEPTSSSWSETPLASLTSSDVFVFSNGSYAMTNNNSTSSAPSAVSITVSKGNITSEVTDVMKWNVGGNGTDGYTFYPNGSTTTWLYCNTEAESGSNNNLRVGTGSRKIWELSGDNLKTKDDKKTRYISIYNSADFRGYVNTDLAITPKFYKAIAGGPSYSNFTTSVKVKTALATPTNLASTAISKGANLSWTKVDHAASYKVEYTGDLETWSVADVSFTTVENTVSCTVNLNPCAGYYWRVTALAATDDPDYKDGVATEGEDYFSTLGYNVTVTVNNVVEDNSNTYKSTNSPKAFDCSETGIALGYEAAENYTLPSNVTVTIGGTTQIKGTDYSWDVEDGMAMLGINKEKVTGAVSISITGESTTPATVTFHKGNGICDTEKLTESSKGAGITLPDASPSAKCAALGWEFAGWSTTQQTEATTTTPDILPSGTYKPAGDVNLYAVYKYTEAGSTEWIRATKVADVTAGGTFILGYEADYTNNKGVIVPMKNTGTATTSATGYMYSGTSSGSSTNGTITMSNLSECSPYEITIAASTVVNNAITIKCGANFIGNENKSNCVKFYTTEADYTAFDIAVDDNDAFSFTIAVNTGHSTDYKYLKFNNVNNAYRYAVYATESANLVLYKKKVNSVTTYIASPECSSTAITLDKGTQGQANGSAVAQKGSKNLAGFTGVTLEVENSYILNGYYSDESDGVKVIDAEGKLVANVTDYTNANGEWTRDDEELTLYAQWTANTFDITLNKNSSAATGSGTAQVTYGAEAVSNFSSDIERTGYTITGFKGGSVIVLNADGTFASDNVAEYIENGKWIKVGNVALDAQWQGEAVELSFNDNGTTTPVQTNVGSKIQLPDLTKGCAGYSNVGWTTTAPENNGWTTKPAIKQGGSNYTVESGVTTFYAVYSEGTGDPNLFEKVTTVSEDGTYMLVWNKKNTDEYYAMNASYSENSWVASSVTLTDDAIEDVTPANRWTFKSNGSGKYSMQNVSNSKYVVCNENDFEQADAANYSFAISFAEGGAVTLHAADCDMEWGGYIWAANLSGWYNYDGDNMFGSVSEPDTYGANYLFKQTGATSYISNPDCREISNITIADESTAETEYYTDETFNPAGLVIQINYTSGDPKKVTYSQSIADDFTFSPALTEYLKTSDKQEKITYGGFDAYLDIIVTVRPSYTVTYDMNGRSGVAPTEVPQYEGTQITIKAAPEVSGQYFGGWKASTDGEIYNAGDLYTMTAENVVFTAQWTTAFIYKKVTDASTLMDGDQIIIANYSLGIAMGSYNSSKYYEPASVVFDNEETTTSVTNDVTVFTLVASNDKWKMKTANGLYLSEGSNKLVLGNTQDEWTISISSGVTSIKVSSNYGPIKCNTNSSNRYACYTSTQSMSVPSIYRKLAYTRAASKFSNGTISTVCLPYGVCQGDFYGCTVYKVTGKELQGGNPYKVFFDQVFSMEAGKPYVVELDENATEAKFFYSGTAVDEPNNENTNGLVGTFTAIDDELNGNTVLMGNYMIYSNQIKKCGEGCLVGKNKAYIKMNLVPEENGSSAAPGRRLTLGVEQAQTPTDVVNVNANENANVIRKVIVNNQMFIIRGGKMYNASGALVK